MDSELKVLNTSTDDDVVVLYEVKATPESKPAENDDKDDAVVLLLDNISDADKKAAAAVVVVLDDDKEEEELVIVRESGDVACRDFPHSRHDCVRFPFDTTPHESHCPMCHCYVCDKPAPCELWTSEEHCHATHKAATWKARRRGLPKLPELPVPTTTPPSTTSKALFTVKSSNNKKRSALSVTSTLPKTVAPPQRPHRIEVYGGYARSSHNFDGYFR